MNVADVVRTIVRPSEGMQLLCENRGNEYQGDLPLRCVPSSPGEKYQRRNNTVLQQEADVDEKEF